MKITKKSIIITIGIVLAIIILGLTIFFVFNKKEATPQQELGVVEPKAKVTISSEKQLAEEQYITDKENESVILVNNAAKATISNSNINKTGNTTNKEENYLNGTNSALVAKESSNVEIDNSNVETDAVSGNGIFALEDNSKIKISNTTISTKQKNSNGIVAVKNGNIEVASVIINTEEERSSAVYAYNGTLDIKDSTLNTNKKASPCIYSKGIVTVANSSGTAYNSAILELNENGVISLDTVDMSAMAIGHLDDGTDDGAILLTGSGNSENGTLTIKNSNINILSESGVFTTAPMFFANNTNAIINLENTYFSFGSNKFLNAKGANITLNAKNMNLDGDIIADNTSSININLEGSILVGTINEENSAKQINIKLNSESLWVVNNTCYVTSITDELEDFRNIQSNGNIIYYDANNEANANLNGAIVTLMDGGILKPME